MTPCSSGVGAWGIEVGSEKYLQPMKESAAIVVMPKKYIRSAAKASYRCIGPFPMLLPGIRELADVAKDTIEWLQSNGFRDTPLANNLNSALAQVEREYPLN